MNILLEMNMIIPFDEFIIEKRQTGEENNAKDKKQD